MVNGIRTIYLRELKKGSVQSFVWDTWRKPKDASAEFYQILIIWFILDRIIRVNSNTWNHLTVYKQMSSNTFLKKSCRPAIHLQIIHKVSKVGDLRRG